MASRIAPLLTKLLLLGFVLLFLVYPLVVSLKGAFWFQGAFTFEFFIKTVRSSDQWEGILNSLNVAALCTWLALVMGGVIGATFPLVPGSRWIHAALIVPLILPPFIGTLGIKQFLGRFGPLNVALTKIGFAPIDWLGSGKEVAIAFVQASHLFPIVAFAVYAGIAQIPESTYEAARSVGASKVRIFFRVILPQLVPALFGSGVLVFVSSVADVGTPLLFQGNDFVAVKVYKLLSDLNENPMGYCLVIWMAILSVGGFLLARSLAFDAGCLQREGKAQRALRIQSSNRGLIGALSLFIYGVLFLSFFPHIMVAILAFSEEWFLTLLPSRWTIVHLEEVFSHPLTVTSIKNSLLLSACAVVLCVILGGAGAWWSVRGSRLPRWIADTCSLLPLAIPGMLFAVGYVAGFSGTILDNRVNPFPLLVIAYAVRKSPFLMRSVTAGLQQASVTLEEAGRSVGATPLRVMAKITLPLVMKQVVAGALLCFCFSVLEVSDSIFLAMEDKYSPIARALLSLSARPDGIPLACALGLVVTATILITLGTVRKLMGDKVDEVLRA